MAYKNAHGVRGNLTQPLPASFTATVMQLDTGSSAQLQSLLSAPDWTFMLIGQGATCEVVQVFYSATNNWPISRAQDGSLLNTHVIGDPAHFELTALAVAAEVTPVPMVVTGGGILSANTSGIDVSLDVPPPSFTGSGLTITGTWPNLVLAVTEDDTSCCGETSGGGSGVTSVFGSGLAVATQAGSVVTIAVAEPNFTGTGIAISGSWPNLAFALSGGSAGTVVSVTAGAGISVTGSPTSAPVVNLAATGVTAGAYGGLTVNAYGQLTAVDPTFNPPSTIVTGGSGLTAARVGNVLTLTPTPSAEGTVGVVALADASDPLDPTDHSTAVNPALLAAVIAGLSAGSVSGTSNYTPVATGLYTNILSGVLPVNLSSGESMLVHAHVTMVNTTTPGTPVEFGIAVFNTAGSGTIVQGDQLMTQSQQAMTLVIAGPLVTNLALLTTAVPSGSAVVSYGLVALTPG